MSLQSLIEAGVQLDRHPEDLEREGAFTVPCPPGAEECPSVTLRELAQHAKGSLADFTMQHLAIQDSATHSLEPGVLQMFCPGLNTAEPEASRRTAYYVDKLRVPMAHFHNGSTRNHGVKGLRGKLAAKRDWLHSLFVYRNISNSILGDRIEELILLNLAQAKPQKIRAAFYSDSTIAYLQAMIHMMRNIERGKSELNRTKEEVEALLSETLFVELYGNGCNFLPKGPQYVIWTDINDSVTYRKDFFRRQHWGCSGKFPDPNNPDVLYIDYEGPYTDKGFNAHNLPANGIHVVRETLQRNGCANGEELYHQAMSGKKIDVPARGEVEGDPAELWD